MKLCPYCKKKVQKKGNPFWPFCSERCKLIDLGKWAKGDYRIPGDSIQKELQEESEGDKKENGDEDVD